MPLNKLNDTPQSWYMKVKEVLFHVGGKVSAYNSLFIWCDKDCFFIGILVSYVGDFDFCGNKFFKEQIIVQ